MSLPPARRRDAGILQTTERDILSLTWIAEQYCICFDHVRSLLAYHSPASIQNPELVAISTARNAVERWLQMGYIETPQKIIREHCTYIWLSRRGLKELDLPYSFYQPKPSTIRHIYATNTIRLHIQRHALSATWNAQRMVRLQNDHRPLPDAELRTNNASFAPVALGVQVLEQQYIAPITLHDELETLKSLTERYTRIWYFIHAKAAQNMKVAIQEYDTKTPTDQKIFDRLIWYSLDAKEIPKA